MKSAIVNGRVIDAAHDIDRVCGVYLEDGVIAAVGAAPPGFEAAETVDASGHVVCPGLFDLRARTREPGLEKKATIASEALAAAHGGITALCCPPDTRPVVDTPAMVHMIRQRARNTGLCAIHPLGALTVGLAGKTITDMAALAESGCAGLSNGMAAVTNSLVMRRALQYASTFGLPVLLHAQDPWLQGNGCVHEGEISTRLGLPAIPEAAETVGVARELALIDQTGARAHFCQLSSARAVDMIHEAQQKGLPVSADVAVHHLHLCEEDVGFFDTRCHVIPPLRSRADRAALRDAVREGIVGAVCSDHQPHGMDAKLVPFSESEPGISGLETLLPLTLKLVDEGLLDMKRALALVTSAPAALLGAPGGALEPGCAADLCIFDPEQNWTLHSEEMTSRGHNTPFDGWTMKGKVVRTLLAGKTVYPAC